MEKSKLPKYVYDIPYSNYMKLCRALDLGEGWKILAGALNYNVDYVSTWQNAMYRPGGSAADEMLKDYSHRNPTPTELFYLLKANRLLRALETLRNCVPAEVFEEWDKEKQKMTTVTPPEQQQQMEQPKREYIKKGPSHIQTPSSADTLLLPTEELPLPDLNTNYGPNYNKQSPQDKVLFETGTEQTDQWSSQCDTKTYREPMANAASTCGNGKSNLFLPQHQVPPSQPSSYVTTGAWTSGNPAAVHYPSQADAALSLAHHYTYAEVKIATRGFHQQNILGQGGFGCVYKARFERNGQIAAVKVLSEIKQNFQEVELLMKYSHDNIISLHGYSRDGPQLCIIYQYMENGSLEDKIALKMGQEPLTWQQRTNILYGTACGIRYLHSATPHPLIHSDIKSANILLDRHLEPKVSDFGLARMATSGSNPGIYTHYSQKTTHSGVYGSKAYLPVEFFDNNFQMHLATDAFSFGVVVYETCTGMKPMCVKRKPAEKFLYAHIAALYDGLSPGFVLLEVRDMLANWPESLYLDLMELGHGCTEERRCNRPTMAKIQETLCELLNKVNQKAYQRPSSVPGSERSYNLSHHSQGAGQSVGVGIGPLQLQMEYDRRNSQTNQGSNSPQSANSTPDLHQGHKGADVSDLTAAKLSFHSPQRFTNHAGAGGIDIGRAQVVTSAILDAPPPGPCISSPGPVYENIESPPPLPPRQPKQQIYANVNGTFLDNPENFNYTESLENMENEKRTPSGTDLKVLPGNNPHNVGEGVSSPNVQEGAKKISKALMSSPVLGNRGRKMSDPEFRDIRVVMNELRQNMHSDPPPDGRHVGSLLPASEDSLLEDDTNESVIDIKREYFESYVSSQNNTTSFKNSNQNHEQNEPGHAAESLEGQGHFEQGQSSNCVQGDLGENDHAVGYNAGGNTDEMLNVIAQKRNKVLPAFLDDVTSSDITDEELYMAHNMMGNLGPSYYSASEYGQAGDSLAGTGDDFSCAAGLQSLNIRGYEAIDANTRHPPTSHFHTSPPSRCYGDPQPLQRDPQAL